MSGIKIKNIITVFKSSYLLLANVHVIVRLWNERELVIQVTIKLTQVGFEIRVSINVLLRLMNTMGLSLTGKAIIPLPCGADILLKWEALHKLN